MLAATIAEMQAKLRSMPPADVGARGDLVETPVEDHPVRGHLDERRL
jgi:hypothetical protein